MLAISAASTEDKANRPSSELRRPRSLKRQAITGNEVIERMVEVNGRSRVSFTFFWRKDLLMELDIKVLSRTNSPIA
ncbi:hypothetical protein Nepgr_000051 [Nepenthes gracilis]|uniref:Uncharacterized protein n=1 Tax=Nepenthes gracilis TaxID=150966 RepID=A0AAD3P3A1_NEPGR|nr:hypothetical protein Nepgr_000051 [Nepenthes gracilis]